MKMTKLTTLTILASPFFIGTPLVSAQQADDTSSANMEINLSIDDKTEVIEPGYTFKAPSSFSFNNREEFLIGKNFDLKLLSEDGKDSYKGNNTYNVYVSSRNSSSNGTNDLELSENKDNSKKVKYKLTNSTNHQKTKLYGSELIETMSKNKPAVKNRISFNTQSGQNIENGNYSDVLTYSVSKK